MCGAFGPASAAGEARPSGMNKSGGGTRSVLHGVREAGRSPGGADGVQN